MVKVVIAMIVIILISVYVRWRAIRPKGPEMARRPFAKKNE